MPSGREAEARALHVLRTPLRSSPDKTRIRLSSWRDVSPMGGFDFMVTPGENALKLTQSEMVGIYPSSNDSEWLVCRDGGSSIAWRPHDGFQLAEAVQASDDLSRIVFAEEVFEDAKPAMYDPAYHTQELTGATAMAQSANEQGA